MEVNSMQILLGDVIFYLWHMWDSIIFVFFVHFTHQLLNILKLERDIKQQNFWIIDLHGEIRIILTHLKLCVAVPRQLQVGVNSY